MSDQEVTVETLDDKQLFEGAISDPVEQPKQEVQTEQERPRNDKGQFAPKTEAEAEPVKTQEAAKETPATESEKEGQVPSWRHREVAEEKRQAQARAEQAERRADAIERQLRDLQANQPKKEPTDFFTNPEGAVNERLSPFETRLSSLQERLTLQTSRALALAEYGKPAVSEMEEYIGRAMQERHPDMPLLSSQMKQSEHPVDVAMNWYRREKLIKETGGDISAYKTKTLEEALKDPAFLAKALEAARQSPQAKQNATVQLPPSLNKIASAARSDEAGDLSNDSLYAHAIR